VPGDRLRARALPPLRSPQRLGGRGPQLSRTIAAERRRYGLPVVDHVVVVATGGYSSAAQPPVLKSGAGPPSSENLDSARKRHEVWASSRLPKPVRL
jgi:hypothetical protein